MLAPAGTPEPILQRLNAACAAALRAGHAAPAAVHGGDARGAAAGGVAGLLPRRERQVARLRPRPQHPRAVIRVPSAAPRFLRGGKRPALLAAERAGGATGSPERFRDIIATERALGWAGPLRRPAAGLTPAMPMARDDEQEGKMMSVTRRRATLAGRLGFAALAPGRARAAGFPQGGVRLLVGFSLGGAAGLVTWLLTEALRPVLGQTAVVEDHSAASGHIAAGAAAKSPAERRLVLVDNPTRLRWTW